MNRPSKNIVVLGTGNLGSRHLQGLSQIDFPANIQGMDIYAPSRDLARERLRQVSRSASIRSMDIVDSLNALNNEIDLAVVATCAQGRLELLKDLFSQKKVNNLVIEKVAFQSTQEFEQALALIKENGARAWVNCPRRAYPFYQEFKKSLSGENQLMLTVTGGNWGLACNAIHYLDLLSFLMPEFPNEVVTELLDSDPLPSKRAGFLEISGILAVRYTNGSKVTLISHRNSLAPCITSFLSDSAHLVIDEALGNIQWSRRENNWKWETQTFQPLYQSQLSQTFAHEILIKNQCSLTSIEESYKTHAVLLNRLLAWFNARSDQPLNACPIT